MDPNVKKLIDQLDRLDHGPVKIPGPINWNSGWGFYTSLARDLYDVFDGHPVSFDPKSECIDAKLGGQLAQIGVMNDTLVVKTLTQNWAIPIIVDEDGDPHRNDYDRLIGKLTQLLLKLFFREEAG